MAIQMRRGPLAQYDESKMLAGEWGISIDADSNDQKAFIAFAPGVSKEVMMVEDAQEQIAVATAEAIVDATAKAEAYAHGDSFSVNDYASGDGTTTSFTLSETPSSVIAVYVDGAETTAYTRSGAVITFTTAPPVGEDNIRVFYTVNTTSDNAKYYKNQAASSASSASTSAQTATTQATNAANARQAIENMTATASSLPPGSTATVTKTTVSGVVNLAFGIPIGKDGEKGETSGIPVEEMTQAQYDALPEASKLDEKLYLITDGDSGWEAESVEYDNTASGLSADNLQDAVDELSGAVDELDGAVDELDGEISTLSSAITALNSRILSGAKIIPVNGSDLVTILNKNNMVLYYFVTRISTASAFVGMVQRYNDTIYTKEVYNSGSFSCVTNTVGTVSLRYSDNVMGVYGIAVIRTV